jgi:nucleoid DNA-binding protein
MNKSDLLNRFASVMQCTMAEADKGYSYLVEELANELKVTGTTVLPGVAKFVIKKVPAREACKKVIAGKEYDLPAKPASRAVRARLLKPFVDKVQ